MTTQATLNKHVDSLLSCTLCPQMHKPVVSGRPVLSKVLLIGQAPGDKEPKMQKPFAWTAGKTLFRWFNEACGLDEEQFRSRIYMAAVCRCFPGKKPKGGDRVPDPGEIENCSRWLKAEMRLLKPELVIPVGKLAIMQVMEYRKLDEIIGQTFDCTYDGHRFEAIPLPHPSGASPWPRMEPGKTLLQKALKRISTHPAMVELAS